MVFWWAKNVVCVYGFFFGIAWRRVYELHNRETEFKAKYLYWLYFKH